MCGVLHRAHRDFFCRQADVHLVPASEVSTRASESTCATRSVLHIRSPAGVSCITPSSPSIRRGSFAASGAVWIAGVVPLPFRRLAWSQSLLYPT